MAEAIKKGCFGFIDSTELFLGGMEDFVGLYMLPTLP
jgi:hypothetical protein